MTDNPYAARAAAGAAFLDSRLPGWAGRIERTALDMADCKRCILGQLFGDFFNGARILDISVHEDVDAQFGVNLSSDEVNAIDESCPHGSWKAKEQEAFDLLGLAWLAEIDKRTKRTTVRTQTHERSTSRPPAQSLHPPTPQGLTVAPRVR